MKLEHIAKRFRIDKPDKFQLSKHDPAECCGLTVDKNEAQAMLADGIEHLAELQQRLYADDRWSVLIVLQAMDAAGKDGVIKHVMSGINPQGCEVHSFKQPSAEELQHDFLWRVALRLPTNGRIGIFNRSHYEEVLIVRVHKELLAQPETAASSSSARTSGSSGSKTSARSNAISRAMVRVILKFLPQRLEGGAAPALPRSYRRAGASAGNFRWATSPSASCGTNTWPPIEDMIRADQSPEAPWYVVPADHKWFSRIGGGGGRRAGAGRPRA